MKPYLASVVNAIVLVLFGLWGYFGSDDPSLTALIPVAAGIILLLLSPGLRKENRTVAHISVIFTFLVLVALFKPLTGAIERSDSFAVIRVLIMIASTLMALVVFVKSFLDARARRSESR
jgi:hypothetical protein